MDKRQRFLQRYLDGELGAGEAHAVRAMASQGALAADLARLERVDRAMAAMTGRPAARPATPAPATPDGLEGDAARHRSGVVRDADHMVQAIMEGLPPRAPQPEVGIRLSHLLTATTVIAAACLLYGLAAQLGDLLPIGMVGGVSVLLGALIALLPAPLRRAEAGILERLLRQRILVGRADLAVVRLSGSVLVIGGLWVLHAAT